MNESRKTAAKVETPSAQDVREELSQTIPMDSISVNNVNAVKQVDIIYFPKIFVISLLQTN